MTKQATCAFIFTLAAGLGTAGQAAACGGEDHKDDKKESSVRLCGGEDHKDDKKESATPLCDGEDHKGDKKEKS